MTSFDFDVIGDTPQKPPSNVQIPAVQKPAAPAPALPETPPDSQAKAETSKAA